MKKFIALTITIILLSSCGVVENVENISVPEQSAITETSVTATEVPTEIPTEISTEIIAQTIPVETTTVCNTTALEIIDYNYAQETETVTVHIPDVPFVQQTQPATIPANHIMTNAEKHLAQMTLHEKICQMFIVVPEAINGYDTTTYVDCAFHGGYAQYPVGGLILFAKNIENSAQTSALTADMQYDAMYAGTGAFIATDEEGGTVTRVQSKLGTASVYNMNYYGELNDRNTAFSVGETIGSYLAEYGFNLDFAPVADVNISPYNELGSRIFSTDPQIVADMSGAVVDGLQSQGICSTLKHFPGLGAGNNNTHYGSVWIERTYDELQTTEFPAFKGGIEAGTDFIMVGHQITSASGDNLPGDLSHVVVTDWLKNELGFDGIAVTDSHAMGAISNVYTSGEAAVLAIEAGIDMVLMPYSLTEAVAGVEQAVESGRLSEERINESVLRILEKKDEMGLI